MTVMLSMRQNPLLTESTGTSLVGTARKRARKTMAFGSGEGILLSMSWFRRMTVHFLYDALKRCATYVTFLCHLKKRFG